MPDQPPGGGGRRSPVVPRVAGQPGDEALRGHGRWGGAAQGMVAAALGVGVEVLDVLPPVVQPGHAVLGGGVVRVRDATEPPHVVGADVAVAPRAAILPFLGAGQVRVVEPVVGGGPDISGVAPLVVRGAVGSEVNGAASRLAWGNLVIP